MTWRWLPLGLVRPIFHAVEAWRRDPGQEARYEPACGGGSGDVEIDIEGNARCLACVRKLAAG